MRVLKKAGLLVIVLLAALFASFVVTGNVAYAEDPPKISDHLYDPGNKMGKQAEKVKERLASLDRSGLHVYVAFPSEYSNDTVSNWNLMALQKSGAPQGSYMLSIVADNPNQTMYLASADNAAKLSQEELSAIASDKMVPLLNQQKYPEAVLAYLDALSAKAPEMGSGLAVAPWAMIAFLIALIVVIIVISRMLKARRKAKDHAEERDKADVLASEAAASPVVTPVTATPATEEQTAPAPSVPAATEAESSEEDEQPRKRKFGFKFGGKKKAKASASDSPLPEASSTPAAAQEEAVTAATSPAAAPVTAAATPHLPEVSAPSAPAAVSPQPASTAAAFKPQFGKVPSLAELDQIALARTKAASQSPAGTTGSGHAPVQSPQAPQVREVPQEAPQAPALQGQAPVAQQPQQFQPQAPQEQPQVQQPPATQPPQPQPVASAPQTVTPGSSPLPQAPASSPLAATATPAVPTAAPTVQSPQMSAPQAHSSVLRPGATTYLPPEANDDDTQVTSAAQIKDYGQERRDEIARAKARAQAINRFRQEQAHKQAAPTPERPASYQPGLSPLPTTPSPQQQAAVPVTPPAQVPSQPAPQPQLPTQVASQVVSPVAPQEIPQVSPQMTAPVPGGESSQAPRQAQAAAPSGPEPTTAPQTIPQVVPQETPRVEPPVTPQTPPQAAPPVTPPVTPQTPPQASERPAEPGAQPDFTKVLRQADSWARKGSSKLALAQERFGKSITQPFALALVRAQDAVRAAFAEFATAQLQSRPIDQQIVAGNLPAPLRELRDQITHFTNLYHQQTPLPDITRSFERQIIECREDLVRCRLIVERIQNDDPQNATRIGEDVMGAHKLLARAQNLLEEAKTMDRAGQENEVLKATVRTENLLLQGRKIARQARAEEAALQAAEKVTQALTFEEKVEPLSEQVAILMAAVDDYIGVHTAKVGVAARTMLDLANRTLTRLDRPGNHDTQEALRLLQRAKQQTEQALRLAENDVAKRS
ncbi:hypothetical protein [Varibaculum prostatecancerukia]|uniref:hypothetical protein n=1 Tax=Varibaculum prostatecancerukia TaxID=2811781 RepID=UPI001C00773B|nr:hypothetical protein [Varibaculum prostatecancerukia]